jgi:hypothetical protein
MNDQRDHGLQPISEFMAERDLKPADLVRVSPDQITHKMVKRAMKGRQLTRNTMDKVSKAYNLLSEEPVMERELFNYLPPSLKERRGQVSPLPNEPELDD